MSCRYFLHLLRWASSSDLFLITPFVRSDKVLLFFLLGFGRKKKEQCLQLQTIYCLVTIILPKHHSVVENMLWILGYWECWVCSELFTFGFWAKLQSCSCKQAFLACQKAQWEIGKLFSCLHSQKVLHDLLLRNMFAERPQWFASKKQGWFLSEKWELWRSYCKLLLFWWLWSQQGWSLLLAAISG